MKNVLKIISLVMVFALALCACSNATYTTSSSDADTALSQETNGSNAVVTEKEEKIQSSESGNLVKFTMENGGSFIIELYPQYAPETVENFKNLVATGFYDGLTFHRVIEGFMAQGGDPEGTGFGGSDKTIKGEFKANDFIANTLSHTRGVVSMARSTDYDSASSQFFICYDDASFLDGDYAAFGKVIEGLEVVDAFLEIERRYNGGELSVPVEPIVIESAVVVE
ncbi:MAG: peptidylprolyl isomerase [Clostridia bacterium]|nr:peptidylprolyl isomerase [Clostridia bacterium]